MAVRGLRAMIYDANLVPQYPLLDYESLTVREDVQGVGVATMTLRADHRRVGDLHIPGRRAVIKTLDGRTVLSGAVTRVSAASPVAASMLSVTIEDDARVLQGLLGWVNPAGGPDQQKSDTQDAYWTTTAPAETAVKALVGANLARVGSPIRVAPSLGRGSTVTLRSRMSKIADVIYPTVVQAGVIPYVAQQPNPADPAKQEVVFDVKVGTARPLILTSQSPQITKWQYDVTGPAIIRGVAGGSGQGTARTWATYTDPTLAQQYGPYWVAESFEDQRQESRPDSLLAGLKSTIASAGPQTAMSIDLEDRDSWRYGSAWVVGDTIRVRLVPGAPVQTVQITSATHSHTTGGDGGYTVTSQCSPLTAAKTTRQAVYQLARRIRNLETGL